MKTDGPWNKEGLFHTTSRGNSTKASTSVRNRKSNHIQVIPVTNKFEVLSSLNDPREAVSSTSASIERVITSKKLGEKTQKMNQKKTQGPNTSRRRRQRILLTGDSHANCATDLQHNLGGNYEVLGLAKPGTIMEEIVKTFKLLSDRDLLIGWGGYNDISRNQSKEAINQLCKFVKGKNKVNLVIMKTPPRHDTTSCPHHASTMKC